MTESEWWAATEPGALIDWLFFDAFAIERKLRLFCAACCRRFQQGFKLREVKTALECVECFADGSVTESQANEVRQDAVKAYQVQWGGILDTPPEADATRAVISALSCAGDIRSPFYRSREWYISEDNFPYPYWTAIESVDAATDDDHVASLAEVNERHAQVRLLHDIFGPLPFREVPIDPEWLTFSVKALARGIYDNKTFDQMPILADALQDAGCDNVEILNHCRDKNQTHVRGCWVLDLLLRRPWRETP